MGGMGGREKEKNEEIRGWVGRTDLQAIHIHALGERSNGLGGHVDVHGRRGRRRRRRSHLRRDHGIDWWLGG